MSGSSTNAVAWSTRLAPPFLPDLPNRADDVRLGAALTTWAGDIADLWPGRPVLLGFPQDEGVRRNGGRPGAAAAPRAIRSWLYRLGAWDAREGLDLSALRPLDLGDVIATPNLEDDQGALGVVVGAVLSAGAIPIVLGGGHETAYGHFLGYVAARRQVAILNIDAHLDVQPLLNGQGHSGSPFRQALEHPNWALAGDRYACLGAQPSSISREHVRYVEGCGGRIHWRDEVHGHLVEHFERERGRSSGRGCQLYVSLDADVVRAGDMPGVSAPNPLGLDGVEVAACLRRAGATTEVSSLDVVEVCPTWDIDGRSARSAALFVWHFLAGLVRRRSL